jgi:cytochrome c
MGRISAAAAVLSLAATTFLGGGAATPPTDDNFQKVTLDDFPGEPIAMAVLPDRRVLHTARTGQVRIHDPASGRNILAATVPVYRHDEEGVQGIAIDADFNHNKWVYLYYSPVLNTPVDDPATPNFNEGDAPNQGTAADFARFKGFMQLSRFKLNGNTLALGTEQKILQVATDRGICCHVGGKIDFDSDGNLYLSTGDDTNPFASDGYVPLDVSPGRNPAYDAERSAANTNDLRGKLLRIKVKPNGGYTIPRGNLFRPGTAQTRPEIYLMGLRNPFRYAVDRTNDRVYLADYSPDARTANPGRGPAGQGRWMSVEKPGNFGWPYCVSPTVAYVAFDFATRTSGAPFNCAGNPVNDSPYNTGLRVLPKVQTAQVIYSYDASAAHPELGTGGIGPMGGPAYDFSRRNRSQTKWPAYFDGLALFYEWTRDYVKEFDVGRNNQLQTIKPVLPSIVFDNPMDLEFGPDGALYVLEYGDGFFLENPDAQLARIDFVRGNRTPIPKISGSPLVGRAPFTVNFSSAGTTDPDGDTVKYEWDFDANGTVDSTDPNPSFTYTVNADYRATLNVTDSTGRRAAAELPIHIGPVPPAIRFIRPATNVPFHFGDTVQFEVAVTDVDAPIDCTRVTVNYILGHDQHGHPQSTASGCTGQFTTVLDGGHAGAGNLTAVFVAQYTDADGQTGSATRILTPAP